MSPGHVVPGHPFSPALTAPTVLQPRQTTSADILSVSITIALKNSIGHTQSHRKWPSFFVKILIIALRLTSVTKMVLIPECRNTLEAGSFAFCYECHVTTIGP